MMATGVRVWVGMGKPSFRVKDQKAGRQAT